jgi:aspartyl-tRNA(Asn)/glutamyl-tRNA(Gln) amidotransferase subunit C
VALTEEELEHLERLARVRLSDASRERLREQLERIIEFVKRLQATDTAGIEPCLPREEVLAASPGKQDGCFSVPPVIEADEL